MKKIHCSTIKCSVVLLLRAVGHMSINGIFSNSMIITCWKPSFHFIVNLSSEASKESKIIFSLIYVDVKLSRTISYRGRRFPLLVLASVSAQMEKSNSIHIYLICTLYFLLNIFSLSNKVPDCQSALLSF